MDTNHFNIIYHYLSDGDCQALPGLTRNCISIIGANKIWELHIEELSMFNVNLQLSESPFLRYDISFIVEPEDKITSICEAYDCNVIFIGSDSFNDPVMVTARCQPEELLSCLLELQGEIDKVSAREREQMIVAAAVADFKLFQNVLNENVPEITETKKKGLNLSSFFSVRPLISESLIIDFGSFYDDIAWTEKDRNRSETIRDLINAANRLPSGLKSSEVSNNHEYEAIVLQILSELTEFERIKIFMDLMKNTEEIGQKLRFDLPGNVELGVKKRSSKTDTGYNDNSDFAFYLSINENGVKRDFPLKFSHNNTYVVYLMCAINRKLNVDDTSAIKFTDTNSQALFKQIYSTLFSKKKFGWKDAYRSLIGYRYVDEHNKTKTRSGRLNDYIKEIRETIDNMLQMGLLTISECIALKPRSSGMLYLSPERIVIPQELWFVS